MASCSPITVGRGTSRLGKSPIFRAAQASVRRRGFVFEAIRKPRARIRWTVPISAISTATGNSSKPHRRRSRGRCGLLPTHSPERCSRLASGVSIWRWRSRSVSGGWAYRRSRFAARTGCWPASGYSRPPSMCLSPLRRRYAHLPGFAIQRTRDGCESHADRASPRAGDGAGGLQAETQPVSEIQPQQEVQIPRQAAVPSAPELSLSA